MVVTEVPVGHVVAASTRRAHRGDELHVHEVTERQLAPVVPPGVVHELPQQFDRGLSSVLLNLRHVQIVDEYHHLFSRGWAECTLLALGQLTVHDVLGHVRGRLRGEVHERVAVQLAVDAVGDVPLDVRRLAGARGSDEAEILSVRHQRVDEKRVPDGIHGWHDDGRVRGIFADRDVFRQVHPSSPRPGWFIEAKVVNRLGVRLGPRRKRLALDLTLALQPRGHPRHQFLRDVVEHELSEVRVKLGPAFFVDAGADGPHEREQKERIDPHGYQRFFHRRNLIRVFELVE